MITEDILITSKDLMKWLNREITEDDEELCMYLSNAVKNQYEYHKEIERLNKEKDDLDDYNRHLYNEIKRLNNIINELDAMFNGDLDGFFTINEKGSCNEIIEVIQNYKNKLKELRNENAK